MPARRRSAVVTSKTDHAQSKPFRARRARGSRRAHRRRHAADPAARSHRPLRAPAEPYGRRRTPLQRTGAAAARRRGRRNARRGREAICPLPVAAAADSPAAVPRRAGRGRRTSRASAAATGRFRGRDRAQGRGGSRRKARGSRPARPARCAGPRARPCFRERTDRQLLRCQRRRTAAHSAQPARGRAGRRRKRPDFARDGDHPET